MLDGWVGGNELYRTKGIIITHFKLTRATTSENHNHQDLVRKAQKTHYNQPALLFIQSNGADYSFNVQ